MSLSVAAGRLRRESKTVKKTKKQKTNIFRTFPPKAVAGTHGRGPKALFFCFFGILQEKKQKTKKTKNLCFGFNPQKNQWVPGAIPGKLWRSGGTVQSSKTVVFVGFLVYWFIGFLVFRS